MGGRGVEGVKEDKEERRVSLNIFVRNPPTELVHRYSTNSAISSVTTLKTGRPTKTFNKSVERALGQIKYLARIYI